MKSRAATTKMASTLPGLWAPLATAIIVFIVWDPPLAHGGKSEYKELSALDSETETSDDWRS